MTEVMHPVGLLPDGTILHINDPSVRRGLAAGVCCPTCHSPFVARLGTVNARHFAHHADNPNCAGSLMSDAHRYAQQILLDASHLTLPARFAHARSYPDRMVAPALPARYSNPTITGRVRRPSYVLDAMLSLEPTTQPLGIEVRYRHAVDEEKQAKIRADNLAVVEIDIARVHPAMVYDPERFTRHVLHEAPRHWLHIPEQASLDAAYQAELDAAAEARRQAAEQQQLKAEAEKALRAAEFAAQRAASVAASQQALETAVNTTVAWASHYYPARQTTPPDFASLRLDATAIASILNRLPDKRALLALMDQPWFRAHAPPPLVTSRWNQLPRETP